MAAETIARPKLSGVADYIATVAGIGLLPIMPGTWCSIFVALPALFLAVTIDTIQIGYGIASLVFLITGLWSDPSVVVIDEALGMSIVFLFPAASTGWAMWACSLFLFRLFDVMKPWPIDAIDKRSEPWAVLGDDLLAGLLAGICVQLVAAALMALGIVNAHFALGS